MVSDAVERWCRQSSHYEWLSGYLATRGMRGATRVLMAFSAASAAACLLALLGSADRPTGTVPITMMWLAIGGGVAGAALWCLRWPTHRESVAFAAVTSASTALACLAYPTPLPAVVGCIAFAFIGAYIAFFHTTGFVLCNFAVAAAVATSGAVRMAASGDPILAAVDWWLVIQINIALPVAIQVLVRALGADLLRDPLTGLANRTLFNDRLNHAMQVRERDGLAVGLISLDLNDFKLVNDNLGHAAGDELLNRTGERILGGVRAGDTVARLGGDEFAVLIVGSVDHMHLIAHRVAEAFDRPFVIHGHELLMCPSVGLALAEAEELDVSAQELLGRADIAMYSAKRSQTGGVHTFTQEMESADSIDKDQFGWPLSSMGDGGAAAVHLLAELREAIDLFELTIVYQPKFDLRTSRIVGVEALLRWPHPERGLLGPEEFLPLVRRHGLMVQVNHFVVNRALDDALVWHAASVDVPVAVNLFAPTLANLKLPAAIARALADRGLSSSALTVEITEHLLLDNMERTQTVLKQLRHNGIRIAIDDFGTGYSTLSYLRDLPIDEVKLDRSFIAPILVDERTAAVVRAVVDLAHVLGLTTVAEGVEDAATAARLQEYGCDVGQGYFYCPPVTSAELLGLLMQSAAIATAPSAPASERSG